MKSDIQIAQESKTSNINVIAKNININDDDLILYGKHKAKVNHNLIRKLDNSNGKVVLVTAINPTPAGEGKTTTTIGLGDALNRLEKNPIICLREPSLGPVFGMKGGATGGGYSQVVPMEDINLHFTGDLHAITSANNLLAAVIDNHIYHGNGLNIDGRTITWKRAVDMNDRQLRFITNGLGGKVNGVPREDGFDITVASEIMAVFCLATSLENLKERISNILVAYTFDKKPIYVKDLKAEGAITALLKDAFDPNLVQTLEGTPTFIHGGPFANIAHGCNSVIATNLARKLGDIVVTEAGFGADLGAEKFLDIKCRQNDMNCDAVVIVATVRALKYHGGCKLADLGNDDLASLQNGLKNLEKHIDNIQNVYGLPVVVAINKFGTDKEEEINIILEMCQSKGVEISLSEVFAKGGEGGLDLAKKVLDLLEEDRPKFTMAYDSSDSLEEKINKIAKKIYGATGVSMSKKVINLLSQYEEMGYGDVPICVAKTPYSFTDNAALLGIPQEFELSISDVRLSAGAGFIVVITGAIMTMPGLPKKPAAEGINVDNDGVISGLY